MKQCDMFCNSGLLSGLWKLLTGAQAMTMGPRNHNQCTTCPVLLIIVISVCLEALESAIVWTMTVLSSFVSLPFSIVSCLGWSIIFTHSQDYILGLLYVSYYREIAHSVFIKPGLKPICDLILKLEFSLIFILLTNTLTASFLF